jgi:glutaredoxin 3
VSYRPGQDAGRVGWRCESWVNRSRFVYRGLTFTPCKSLFRGRGGNRLENVDPGAHISTADSFASFQETVLSDTSRILIYTTAVCPYCVAAKNFLKSKGQSWTEVRVDTDPAEREKMIALTRRTSVPQIFIGDTHVGGYDDMIALHRAGGLEPLLESVA